MKCNWHTCKRGCVDRCAAENSYIPSNGTEGMSFMEDFCDQCLHQNPDPDPETTKAKNCEICMRTMCYHPNEPEYPREWIYLPNGKPTCTKFVKWDWNRDGDPDDPDNPNRPPDPPDPKQLNLFPLYPNETEFQLECETAKSPALNN